MAIMESTETVLQMKNLERRDGSVEVGNKQQSLEETNEEKTEGSIGYIDVRYRYCNLALLFICLMTLVAYYTFLFIILLETRICPNGCMSNFKKFLS